MMTVATVAAQGVHVLAAAFVAGALVFMLLTPADEFEARLSIGSTLDLMRLIVVALGVVILSGILWLWSVAAGMSGYGVVDARVLRAAGAVLSATNFGHLWLARACMTVVLCLALFRDMQSPGGRGGTTTVVGAAMALALLASIAAAGHAAASACPKLEIAVLAVHVSAAGLWFGSIAALAISLRAEPADGDMARFAVGATRRVGAMAVIMLLLLAACGTASAFFRLSGAAAIFSGYGQLLIAKSALLFAALALAARNRWRLLPRLSKSTGDAESRRCALLSLTRNVAGETIIVAAILLLAGWLAATPPG